MKVGLRGGHSPNCLGAIGLRNEWACMNTLYKCVADILEEHGHIVIDCNSTANSENEELSEGVRKANNANVDIFVSLHMNSFNGQAHGTEAWVHANAGSFVTSIATRMCDNFANLGFYNRGVKHRNLYEMTHVNAPNIIFETCFCDSEKDISIWSPTPYEVMARAIANAIDPNIPLEKEQEYYRVCVQRFKSKEEADKAQEKISKQLGLYCFTEKM